MPIIQLPKTINDSMSDIKIRVEIFIIASLLDLLVLIHSIIKSVLRELIIKEVQYYLLTQKGR